MGYILNVTVNDLKADALLLNN